MACSRSTGEDRPHVCDSRCQTRLDSTCSSNPATVNQRIADIYKAKKFADLTIIFPETEEKFEVHRLILAMSSPVFESMLYGTSAKEPTLYMPEDSPEGFRWLLDYIYCDVTHFGSINVALEVSHLASKYEMSSLKQLCSEYMQRVLNNANCLEIYNAAIHLNSPDLVNKCSKMMQGTAEQVFSSEQITQLSRHALHYLLQMPCFIPSEVVVFQALIAWGQKRLAARVRTITPADLRHEIEEFIPLVRFLLMTTDEFVESVIPTEIFTPEESCVILRNIRGVQGYPLPSCCSTCQEKRSVKDSFHSNSSR